jgi:sugar/nucleoside kinase (ribokinase family)
MASLRHAVCVLTNGAAEIRATTGSDIITCAPPSVTVADANGAGDVFFGAFAWWWSRTRDVKRALSFGASAAALKCTRIGNRGLPTLAEIEQFEAGLLDQQ